MRYWRAVAAHVGDYRAAFVLTWLWVPAALYFALYGHPAVGQRIGFGKWK